MPSRKEIDLQKVLACMNTKCPRCGHEIEPEEIRRGSSEEMECPACGSRFQPNKSPSDAANLLETRIIGRRQRRIPKKSTVPD
jgi:predicted RNA-binding Zn-ribbon protein involved in translation (DUF1610 family)